MLADMSESTRQLDEAIAMPGPARCTGKLHLGELPGGSRIDVPFTVLRGGSPGSTVWVMAARDGDEVHATLIAMELQRRLDPDELAGTVVVMPIGNVPGFGVLSREHPLAPTYLESQMDDRFFDVLSARGGSFVDLHSAGVPSDTVDWTLFVLGDGTGEAMGKAYGSPFLYEHRIGGGEGADPGLLDDALFARLSRAGVPSILIEAGGGLPPSDATVRRGVAGVENVLRELGAIAGAVRSEPEQKILRGFRIVTPSRGGLLQDGAPLGGYVDVGDVLARVLDAHGELVEEIRAPVAGFVLTVPLNPAIGTGSWAYEIGW
ncbi:MAG: succinylglutamate desuccinylase/aspartoacylase family protein [Actinomycetota bacterium]